MIQRALLRQSRSLASSLRTSSNTTLFRSQFRPQTLRLAPSASPLASARWYATEPESKDEEKVEGTGAAADQSKQEGASEAENPLAKELESKNKEILDMKDRYLRGVAEFRNLQERTKRDMQVARDFAIQQFAKDLVESVDNLDRALGTVPEDKLTSQDSEEGNKDLVALYNGLRMTEEILLNTLKKHGLERFDPSVEGEKFDPNEHEATFMTPMEGKEDGTVFHTQQKGFRLKGRILRAAKVGVVKNPSSGS